jgi:hypothetical protein
LRESTVFVTSVGVFTVIEASKRFGIKSGTLHYRLNHGWTPDEVIGIVDRKEADIAAIRIGWVYGWFCNTKKRCVYVGRTIQGIAKRTADHIRSAESGSIAPLHESIRKLGDDNFEVRKLWKGPASDLSRQERKFIEKHKTLIEDGGLNVHSSGVGGRYFGKSVTVEGVSYNSLAELCRVYGAEYSTIHQRITVCGWTLEEALDLEKRDNRCVEVAVDGRVFSSLKNACEYYGAKYDLVCSRVGSGWSVEDAIKKKDAAWIPTVVEVSVNGRRLKFQSMAEAWEKLANGVKYGTYWQRVKRGASHEKALGLI